MDMTLSTSDQFTVTDKAIFQIYGDIFSYKNNQYIP